MRNTNSESRMSRMDIHKQIIDMLPNHNPENIKDLTNSALNKLAKRYIRHWTKLDEFCLTHEETQRVRGRLSEVEIANISLDSEIQSCLTRYGEESGEQMELLCSLVRSVLDRYLFERGETFAAAIINNRFDKLGIDELQNPVKYVVESKHISNRQDSEEKITSVIASCIVGFSRNRLRTCKIIFVPRLMHTLFLRSWDRQRIFKLPYRRCFLTVKFGWTQPLFFPCLPKGSFPSIGSDGSRKC